MGEKKSVRHALLFSAIGEYSTQILGFVSIMILARLLTPEEIGVYAVAGTASLLATELSSFGVVQFLIREKDIDEKKIRSVLGMSIVVYWGLGLLLILSAPYIAVFYEKPDITIILWILSLSFFVAPFFGVPVALWKRKMQFRQIAIMNLIGQLVSTISLIALVLAGFSYYGMPRFAFLRALAKFGFFSSLTNVFTRLTESIPDLVIGKMATMADVGQFSRGFGAILFLNKIIISAIKPVILPHLAEVQRSGRSVEDAYLRSMNLLLAFTLPVFATASAASYPMIIGLFGDQWYPAVPVTSILAACMMFVSVHSFSASAFIVSGAEYMMFKTGVVITVSRLILVVLTASHGIELVAWAMALSGAIEFTVITLALKSCMGLRIKRLVVSLLPNLVIASVCWLITSFVDQVLDFEQTSPYRSLTVIAVIMPVVWLLMLRIGRHEAWYVIGDIFRGIKRVKPVPD